MTTNPQTDRRDRYATAIRAAGDTAYGNSPFYEAITTAVMAVADAEHATLKRAHVALAAQAGSDQAAVARVRSLHDHLDAETPLTSPDQEITRGAAARKIAAALDGYTAPAAAVSVPASAPTDRAALRQQVIDALHEARRPGLGGMTEADAVASMADAVLDRLPETSRLHDQVLTLRAELSSVRALLRTENERANAAINRETTAEEAEEEQRLALSQALGLGTGAPWDAITERAAELASAVSGSGRVADETQAECGPAPSACDAESGEPCPKHEREAAHAEGEHCFCGPECAVVSQPDGEA